MVSSNHIRFKPSLKRNEKKSCQPDPLPLLGCIDPLKKDLKEMSYSREEVKELVLPDEEGISPCLTDGKMVTEGTDRP
jgi:hypothetical protein